MKLNKTTAFSLAIAGVFVLFTAVLWWIGAYNYIYMEHMRTFFYDWGMNWRVMRHPGGFCEVAADFLVQWFYIPAVAVAVNAALLTLVSWVTARLMKALGAPVCLLPMALLPAISLMALQCNTNYLYSGTPALLLALAAVCITVRADGKLRLRFLEVPVLVAVYVLCGATVTVYALLCVLFAFRQGLKQGLVSLALPVLALAAGFTAVDYGQCGSLSRAILPAAYFTPRLAPSSYVNMPWICLAVSMAVALLPVGRFNKKMVWAVSALAAALMLFVSVAGGPGSMAAMSAIDREGMVFKQLNCMARDGQWDKVEQRCMSLPPDNLLWQNFRSLALAEQGRLASDLFKRPCYDIRSIYITGDSNPYMYMLLSDIYYSMGHIALAQRHAFEANESLGNLSPRMLQRLADTNIEFGNYPVAMKYLNLLAKTHRYASWAGERIKAVEAGVLPPDLESKRQCIFPDNRFSAFLGLDDDLLQVVRRNPLHRATVEYLGCLYLLSKDLYSFKSTMDEFYDTPALPSPLPDSFAQGMLLFADNDSVSARFGIGEDMHRRFDTYHNSPRDNRDNLWFFLDYVK